MAIDLLHIDCMEYMATLPDKAFDLAIVDPPYGLGEMLSGGKTSGNRFKGHWDKMRVGWDSAPPSAEYFAELARVSENRIIWGANYFTAHLPPSMGWVFWYKMQPNFSFSDGEFAYTSFDCKARIFQYSRGQETQAIAKMGSTIHPTQKPVALYKWLLKNYAKPGDRILDTHLGSGSIAIACHDMGFDLVGCEIDEDYIQAARKRLADHQSQLAISF